MSTGSSGSGLIAACSTLPALAIGAVSLRFYARRTQGTGYKMDDWIMLPALTLFIGLGVLGIYNVKTHGYGTPASKGSSGGVNGGSAGSGVGPTYWAFEFILTPTLGCIKIGYLLFYRRVFCTRYQRDLFDYTTLAMVILVALWTIAFEIVAGVQCGDKPWAAWTGSKNYFKYCTRAFPYLLGFAISDFLTDLIIVLLPLPKIWSLKMSIGRKVGISFVFLLALVGFAASIARMVNVIYTITNGRKATADPRLEDTELAFWSILEVGLALVAVNLPSIWSLFLHVDPTRILSAVRSIVSLDSTGSSDKSGKFHSTTKEKSENSRPSTSSQADMVLTRRQDGQVEAMAMHDLEAGPKTPRQLQDPRGILVEESLTQTRHGAQGYLSERA